MKTCPFCQEQIPDGAIKCRYCQSLLTPPNPTAPDDSKTVYVVDTGIIKFAKFAAACLAIFVILGVFAFGIDAKTLVKDMHDTEREMHEAEDKIRTSEDRMRATEDKVQTLIADMTKTRAEFEKAQVDLQKARSATGSGHRPPHHNQTHALQQTAPLFDHLVV